ncbi:MAG: TIR domain-containing protein [Candidatus Binatia bacterium]
MGNDHVFISHASVDDGFVKDLREQLEAHQIPVWIDSRNLRGGNKLAPEISQAIGQARQVLVVLSPQTVNSPWVRKEVQQALQVEKSRNDGYRVIPLLLPGLTVGALGNWFDEEPVAVPIQLKPGGLSEALPTILAALGERLPTDHQPIQTIDAKPVAELTLELEDAQLQTEEGKQRVVATAKVTYQPADKARKVESNRFRFTAPLGPIEAEDLRWYLERYYLWPTGVFQQRAEEIAAKLPRWGQALYEAITQSKTTEALNAWLNVKDGAERRFSLLVNDEAPDGSSVEEKTATQAAASAMLSLPWELLHDGRGYLFQGNYPARVRRRLPNRHAQKALTTALPIRILLVSPRPEDEHTSYIDHRISALPLVEALGSLGELATLTVLTPPTFTALEKALQDAVKAGQSFDVVHFDGHGVYDRQHGLGGLCFEAPNDSQQLQKRKMQLIHADQLAAMMRDHRIPLVFLEACQSATVEEDPTASVAAKLLAEGVSSVVAMSHSVLVETARRFVRAFYAELAQGSRVGQAMLAGQQVLFADSYRGKIMGAGELRLQDWFVPVLYQEEHDPQLVTAVTPQTVRQLQAQRQALSFGALPETPKHTFIGRSRALLALERLLHEQPYAVVLGPGGMGKTTLTVELARWLVRTGRYRRAAFVSLENISDVRAVLDSIARQLLPDGDKYSVTQYSDLKQALQPVQRALADFSTVIVLDNLESVLPDTSGQAPLAAAPVEELFDLCQTLLKADPATRLLFTSREALPEPFNHTRRGVRLGALGQEDAITLVSQVMANEGWVPQASDPGGTAQEISELVEAVNCHPRALVLLAREVSRRGVRATTENLQQLMAELDRKNPGDRENSLYASVELSLRRLSPQVREQVKALAVFHGGAHRYVLRQILVDTQEVVAIARALIDVGLAEDLGRGHLRLDPALPTYLASELSAEKLESLRSRWAEGMLALVNFLLKQQFTEAELVAQLTLLELPNLLALLSWLRTRLTAEHFVIVSSEIEGLIAMLGQLPVLTQVQSIREQVSGALEKWSWARFSAESARIDRLLEDSDLETANKVAHRMLQEAMKAGEGAYKNAAYAIAEAYRRLGEVQGRRGDCETALHLLDEAKKRFQSLAKAGDIDAERRVSSTLLDIANCLLELGRLGEATSVYKDAIKRARKLGTKREIARGMAELAGVEVHHKRYAKALAGYAEAREIFTTLNEPRAVAICWHQIGVVHRQARQFDQAEQAYRQALSMHIQLKDATLEAGSLVELGSLYDDIGRLEQSEIFYRQAVKIYVKLQSPVWEGLTRDNLASTLIKLQRYDEARLELQQAIKSKHPFGHAAAVWKTWGILSDLERTAGKPEAAAAARQQAFDNYLAYRRAGGENRGESAEFFATVAQAIASGDTEAHEQILPHFIGRSEGHLQLKVVLQKLLTILKGNHDPALAEDEELDYRDAVEIQLLLEQLKIKNEE